MAIIKNRRTQEDRDFWTHVEAVARDVRAWPDWIVHRRANEENINHSDQTEHCNDERDAHHATHVRFPIQR